MEHYTDDLRNMKLKSIKLHIIFRILILAVSIFGVAYLIFNQKSIVQSLYASLIPLILIFELITFINKNNRQLRSYLEAIEWDDLSIKMPVSYKDKSFKELNIALNRFNEKLKILREDNFAQYYFIETLIKEALVGLIVIDQSENIYFVNRSFEQIVGISNIQLYEPAKQELTHIWNQIGNLKINEKQTIEIKTGGQSKIILFQVSEFKISNQKLRLFSAQNIKTELESTEIEAWKKLIRILSHEILNSTSPILSLSNTLSDIVQDNKYEKEVLIEKLKEGLNVIIQRSSGLIKFTNSFNTISKLPKPEKTTVKLDNLFQRLQILFQKDLVENEIEFDLKIFPNAQEIYVDQYQIEQVFINLIKNSIESFEDKQKNNKISVKVFNPSDFIRIEIIDNGSGISLDKIDKIFLPFYTTKINGNGIGLALSKQILNQHDGNISVESQTKKGTKIIVDLPTV